MTIELPNNRSRPGRQAMRTLRRIGAWLLLLLALLIGARKIFLEPAVDYPADDIRIPAANPPVEPDRPDLFDEPRPSNPPE